MNWKDALNEIESIEFDVRLNVVSSYRLFLKVARQEPAVVALYQAMQTSEEVFVRVLERICEISTTEIDPVYANPGDTALAVLLWLVSLKNRTYAQIAALYVAGSDNCWYALKMAKDVLAPVTVLCAGIGANDIPNTGPINAGGTEAHIDKLQSVSRIEMNVSTSQYTGMLMSDLA